MSFGQALLRSFLPALMIGPMLGLLGSACLLMFSAGMSDGNTGAGGIFVFALIIGALLGLIVASPICLVCGALMLKLAARNRRWSTRFAVMAIGGIVGGATGAASGWIGEDPLAVIVCGVMGSGLGALGAAMFRTMLSSKLDEPDTIDPVIFA